MLNKLYSDEFFQNTLEILKENLDELMMWSAHNNDSYLNELQTIQEAVETLEEAQ
jgi:hypothetical protein